MAIPVTLARPTVANGDELDATFYNGVLVTGASVPDGTTAGTVCAGNDARLPSVTEKAAFVGTSGTPGSGNKFVTDTDGRLPSVAEKAAFVGTSGTPGSGNKFVTDTDGRLSNSRQCNNNFDSASTSRTNLGLGNSATRNVGTSAGEVCAADDGRLSNSRQCNNNFDSASTSRTNLGLGNSATRNVGTSSGEVCAADDGRLSNSRQCNNNFDSAVTARTNLGLGNTATRDVGTSAGQVAAGDDGRFPSNTEKSALVGTSGTPGSGNKFVTDADSRLTNSRQCNNSFDSASASRSNLGLGNSATRNVGTSAGEVCAADDGRLSNSRQCNNNFDSAATSRTNLGLATVAASGSYSDLSDKPITLPARLNWGSSIASLVGGGFTEDVDVDISAFGWPSKPVSGVITMSSDYQVSCIYSWDESSATVAKLRFFRVDLSPLVGGPYRYSFIFGE